MTKNHRRRLERLEAPLKRDMALPGPESTSSPNPIARRGLQLTIEIVIALAAPRCAAVV